MSDGASPPGAGPRPPRSLEGLPGLRAVTFAWTAVRLALGAIRQRKVRSALTATGILVGVAAVTIVVALGEGASIVVTSAIDTLGTNGLIVAPRPTPQSGLRDVDRPSALDESDAAALAVEVPAVERAAPMLTAPLQVIAEDHNVATTVVGTTRDFFVIREWKVTNGAVFGAAAEANHERVCLIGETVREQLFGPEDPIGRMVRIGRFPFRVVGVLARKGQSPFGGDQDDVLVMPIGTLRSRLLRTRPGQVHRILFSARDSARVEAARDGAAVVLRQRHQLALEGPEDFEIRTQEELRKTQQGILAVLQALLLGIAAVSLAVGGIGVMNIMLVSVAERTREIGIRLAIGARAADIRAQFLVEAVVLSVLGGAGGAVAAALGVAALARALELPMRLSPGALGVALLTSTAVGIVFGFFPARRAAALDPIDALRTD